MGTKSGAYQDVYIKRDDEMVSLKNDVTDFCEKYIKPVHPENWDWIRVKCLGILPFTACPHYLQENRSKNFQNLMMKKGGTGIALDDCTAIEVIGDDFRILRSRKDAQAFRVFKKKGQIEQESFPVSDHFQSLKILSAIAG